MTKIFAIAVLLFTFQMALSQESLRESNPNLRIAAHSVPATAEQLSGKWQITKITNAKKIDIARDKVQGSYFIFGHDQKYTTMVMGAEENGDWKFGPENRSVQLSAGSVKSIWNILSISATELVMQKGARGNIVIFTR